MAASTSPYVSVGKVARMCGVSNRTVLNWISQGKLQAHPLPSGHYRVHVDEVRAFMAAHEMDVPTRLSEATAIQSSLCWQRTEFTAGHDCRRCAVFAAQAWHCFTLRARLGDDAVGCDCSCAECGFLRSLYRSLSESMELDGHPCAVSRGGLLLAVNTLFASLVERAAPDLLGVSWDDLVQADDPSPLFARGVDPSAGGATAVRRVSGKLLRPGDQALPVTLLVAPFPRAYGAVLARLEAR